jgi:hypothetical protein
MGISSLLVRVLVLILRRPPMAAVSKDEARDVAGLMLRDGAGAPPQHEGNE